MLPERRTGATLGDMQLRSDLLNACTATRGAYPRCCDVPKPLRGTYRGLQVAAPPLRRVKSAIDRSICHPIHAKHVSGQLLLAGLRSDPVYGKLLAIEELISAGIGEHRDWAFECRRARDQDCGEE